MEDANISRDDSAEQPVRRFHEEIFSAGKGPKFDVPPTPGSPILDTATVERIGLKVAEAAEALLDGGARIARSRLTSSGTGLGSRGPLGLAR
jgi:hypothetical protein